MKNRKNFVFVEEIFKTVLECGKLIVKEQLERLDEMKGMRACWSINGGNWLTALLCRNYSVSEVSEAGGFNDCYNSNPPLSAAKTPKTDGKGYEPLRNIPIHSNMKWLKHISFCKPFSDLKS